MNVLFGKCLSPSSVGLRFIQQLQLQPFRSYQPGHIRPTLVELNKRRQKVELNHMLKDGKVPVQRRSNFSDWNFEAELKAFGSRLGEVFNPSLLSTALTMKSHVMAEIETQKQLGIENVQLDLQSNEKLAEEGGKLIEKTIVSWLRTALPAFPEEGIASLADYLTSEDMLANVSFHIGTKELVLLEDYPPSAAVLAQVFKAIIGALAETNETRAKKLILDLVATQLAGKDVNQIWDVKNPMGVLANILENEGKGEPESRLLWRAGPKTILACYHVGIYSDRELIGQSPGETVDIAEEMAARDALRNIFKTNEQMSPLPLGKHADVESQPGPNMFVSDLGPKKLPANILYK